MGDGTENKKYVWKENIMEKDNKMKLKRLSQRNEKNGDKKMHKKIKGETYKEDKDKE